MCLLPCAALSPSAFFGNRTLPLASAIAIVEVIVLYSNFWSYTRFYITTSNSIEGKKTNSEILGSLCLSNQSTAEHFLVLYYTAIICIL